MLNKNFADILYVAFIVCTARCGTDNAELWHAVSVGASVQVGSKCGVVERGYESSTNGWNIVVNFDDGTDVQHINNSNLILKSKDKCGDFIVDGTIGDQLLKLVDSAHDNKDKIDQLMSMVRTDGIEYGGQSQNGPNYNDCGIAIEASRMKYN